MPVVVCTACKARINVKEQMLGRTAKCPGCQASIVLKAAEASDAVSAGPPKKPAVAPPKPPAADPFSFGEDAPPPPKPAKKPAKKPKPVEDDDEPASFEAVTDHDDGGGIANLDEEQSEGFEPVDDDDEVPRKARKSKKAVVDDDDTEAFEPVDDEDEDDDDRPARGKGRKAAAKGPSSPFLRVISGVPYLFVLLFFFLPWVSVTCEGPPGMAMMPGKKGEKAEKLVFTQSGFQAMYGAISSPIEKTAPKKAKAGDNPFDMPQMPDVNPRGAAKDDSQGMLEKFSPFTILFLIAALIGLGLGCALPFSKLKTILIGGASGLMALMLVAILIIGLPLEISAHRALSKQREELAKAQKIQQDALKQFGGKMPPGMPAMPELKLDNLAVVAHTPWYWVEWLLVVISPGADVLGLMMFAKGGPAKAAPPPAKRRPPAKSKR